MENDFYFSISCLHKERMAYYVKKLFNIDAQIKERRSTTDALIF